MVDAVPTESWRGVMTQMLRASMCVGASGGVLQMLFGNAAAENMLDLFHSLYCTSVSLRVVVHAGRDKDGELEANADDTRLMGEMLCNSMAYFCVDACYIASELLRGRHVHMWQGRIVHHLLQAVCNVTTSAPHIKKKQVVRRYTAQAYLAEGSQIFMRLHAMRKQSKALYTVAMISFFCFRVVNAPYAMSLVYRHLGQRGADDNLTKLHLVGGTTAYLVNLYWFAMLLKKVKKYQLQA